METMKRILVTGGAGFIGSHIVDALVARGHHVRVLDRFEEQVHGAASHEPDFRPDYLNPNIELIRGDAGDRALLEKALDGVDVVYHKAAAVGVGQSMYEIEKYVQRNTGATAVLLDVLANNRQKFPIERLVVASSMSIYGEGRYIAKDGTRFAPRLRPDSQLEEHVWEMLDSDGNEATPAPTDEEKPLISTSIYALSKKDQEEYSLVVGAAYNIPTVCLRYFNVYGTRQALSNPYTGVAAIFGGRLLNRKAPVIFEDGKQTRDFVHVSDIVQANLLVGLDAEAGQIAGQVYNVGNGKPLTLLEVFQVIANGVGAGDIVPEIPGKFRSGDIRHCYADISKIKSHLGYTPKVSFEEGMTALTEWMRQQTAEDKTDAAIAELVKKGIAR